MDIGLIGYGGVGKALVKLINDKAEYLMNKYNLKLNIKYIVKSNGGIYNPNGLDLNEIIQIEDIENHNLWKYKLDIDYIIRNKDIDTLIELTSTDIETGEPGLTHIKKSLNNKISVVTGNKGPILLDYKNLKDIANKKEVQLKVGCTTGGALPSISGGIYDVAGSEIKSIEGILNGTTNYILSKMTYEGIRYEEALADAQECGIAELDPSLDVLGYDTAGKIVILSNVLMDTELTLNDITVEGIDEIVINNLENKKIKLIGKVEKNNNEIKAFVKPMIIGEDHPLYSVDYKNKGVYFKTDTLGDISIIGGASGTVNAAASILRDVVGMTNFK